MADGGAALERAFRTLVRGTEFLRHKACDAGGAEDAAANLLIDSVRVRLAGNRLRELDRFLGVLTEEIGARIGAPGHDPSAFARLSNTANKLTAVRGLMGLEDRARARLLAIGRIRAALQHCGGRVYRASLWHDLALSGCPASAAASDRPRPAHLILTAGDLCTIAENYAAIATDFMTELGTYERAFLDETAGSAHIRPANVACDGI